MLLGNNGGRGSDIRNNTGVYRMLSDSIEGVISRGINNSHDDDDDVSGSRRKIVVI